MFLQEIHSGPKDIQTKGNRLKQPMQMESVGKWGRNIYIRHNRL